MIRTGYTPRYLAERKKFLKNNPKLLVKTRKAISLLIHNPKYPSLNLEKLKNSPFWSIRIDQTNRIFFFWENKDYVVLTGIGPHDKYREY